MDVPRDERRLRDGGPEALSGFFGLRGVEPSEHDDELLATKTVELVVKAKARPHQARQQQQGGGIGSVVLNTSNGPMGLLGLNRA